MSQEDTSTCFSGVGVMVACIGYLWFLASGGELSVSLPLMFVALGCLIWDMWSLYISKKRGPGT